MQTLEGHDSLGINPRAFGPMSEPVPAYEFESAGELANAFPFGTFLPAG